ncbi:MAG TPA: T9SS type A sorting domain-containing protein, partial [Ignavibacteriaceae bacterium]|nr:T9SS type A sorting domain-containing protein [Ignavibacteriaceae bacterium]
ILPLAGIGAQDKNAIVTSGSNLCVGTTNGIWISTDAGLTWTHSLTSGFITGFNSIDNEVFAVGQLPYKSTDYGVTWTPINPDGLPGSIWNTMQFTANYAFVNFLGVGVYRTSISIVSSINEQINYTADEFRLEQNYPNPFNSETIIGYSVPQPGNVQIIIYDVLGKELQTLLNKYLTAGSYQLKFDAASLPGGVYFYRMISGNLTETKKMILLK